MSVSSGPATLVPGPGGEPPDLFDLVPPPVRECLQRCAVPPSFDIGTFDEILGTGAAAPLDRLVRGRLVEPVPGQPGRLRISAALADPALRQWWADAGRAPSLQNPVPEPLRRVATDLSAVARRQSRPLDELNLLLLHDPAAAASRFQTLYDAADAVHDLPRCTAVLAVLDDPHREPVLGTDLVALRADASTYLSARAMWAEDFHGSARYVTRAAPEDALRELLEASGPHLLQLFARGGMGKSLQLRWFLARFCVPAPRRIPCARLDFDVVHPVAAARHPWLLLLAMAAQLDQQLAGAPFQDLLAAHGHYRALLARSSGQGTGTVAPRTAAPGDGDDVVARFCTALADRAEDEPVVLVLDTFEEVFRPSVQAGGIVRLVRQVLEHVPAARVVLACRYDVRERLADQPVELPAVASHRLEPLTAAEQRRYLTEIRGISDPATVQLIEHRAEGLPLFLSIYADLVTQSAGVTLEALAEFRDPGLHSAIQRVVSRIEDHRVRWLLRYGVVPRRLSLDFVLSVMRPYLAAGMSGRSTADDPAGDARPHGVEPLFRTDLPPLDDDADVREVWEALLHYASDYGWVTASSAEESVEFRSDLLVPLRDLVRPHPVFARLQKDAAAYFQDKARTDPAQWLRWTREAVFHHLQVDADTGARAWVAAVAQARSTGHDDWCLELATDLLGREFVDWQGNPIHPMTPQLLAEGHRERARAAMAVADSVGARGEDPLWSDVADGLAAARALDQRDDVHLPAISLVVPDARLRIVRGDAVSAEALLRDHRSSLGVCRELADVERALGQALLGSRRSGALKHLRTSYDQARSVGDLSGARLSALLEARSQRDANRYAEALATLARARGDGVLPAAATAGAEDAGLGGDDEADLMEVWLLAVAGAPEQAVDLARRLTPASREGPGLVQLAVAAAQLLLEQPWACLASVDEALRLFRQEATRGEDATGPALALRGLALADMHAAGLATQDLLDAASRARAARDLDLATYCAAEAAMVQIRIAGDHREAAQCLDEAQRSSTEDDHEGWARARVAEAHLLAGAGEMSAAADVIDRADRRLAEVGASPELRIDVVLSGLAVDRPEQRRRWFGGLLEQVRAVTPERARLPQLQRLTDVPVVGDLDGLGSALVAAVDAHPADEPGLAPPTAAEQAVRRWYLAELLRVVGRPADSRRLLDEALAARDGDLLSWWRWLDAVERIGPAVRDEPVPDDDQLFAVPQSLPPVAAGVLVHLANRRLDVDGPERTLRRLDLADSLLSRWGERSRWTARSALARARVASQRGDDEGARRAAAEAASAYARLGARVDRDEVAHQYRLGGWKQASDPESVELRFGVPQPEFLPVRIRLPGTEELHRDVPAEVLGDLAIRGKPEAAQVLALIRRAFEPLSGGWRAWSQQVARRVLPPAVLDLIVPAGGQPWDLRLVFSSRDLAALPWELVRLPDRDVPLAQGPALRSVYRSPPGSRRQEAMTRAAQVALLDLGFYSGVADGLDGHWTFDAVREFQRHAGIDEAGAGRDTFARLRQELAERRPKEPLRVLLLRPDPLRQLERRRGDTAASSLVGVYTRYGAQVQVVDDPTPERLRSWATREGAPPHVVHVCAPVRFSAGATVLDLAGDAGLRRLRRGSSAGAELTVSALGELIHLVMRGSRVPLLVLDVTQPSTLTEVARAVGARNSFAHQLMSVGGVQALLATGLASTTDHAEIMDLVVGGLSAGRDVAQVARGVQLARPASTDATGTLAFLATALYLERPPFALFPLWAS